CFLAVVRILTLFQNGFWGGIAGISAVIGFIGSIFHADPQLGRTAPWMGLIGAMLCPGLLISDFGRPTRFLNMLRVFKWRSAMSMGSSAFDGAAFVAVAANEAIRYGSHLPLPPQIARLGDFGGAITGLLFASYTDVLIGATAIPVWHEHRHLLPAHFLTSGLGGSAAMLELLGF
ncbi:MAG: NrfD/PsrC family molybdoenzyme membrane anchor subunit, partial [Candidatus Acidiferrales bacterium]